ncbi:hypothetical protein Fot_41448 [Forsythia ovata]|uniref:Uncharacterized protein n=1 Tax=Forsythia ovata TaxID=205694 RepID=A0ABD1RJ76_9LAMI
MPPAPLVYPPYQPGSYEDRNENEEGEDHYSYVSLTQPEAPFRRNERVDPFQYPYQGYNVEENYENPNLLCRHFQEPETSQASSVFDRLGGRPPRNMRKRRVAVAASRAPHIYPLY